MWTPMRMMMIKTQVTHKTTKHTYPHWTEFSSTQTTWAGLKFILNGSVFTPNYHFCTEWRHVQHCSASLTTSTPHSLYSTLQCTLLLAWLTCLYPCNYPPATYNFILSDKFPRQVYTFSALLSFLAQINTVFLSLSSTGYYYGYK